MLLLCRVVFTSMMFCCVNVVDDDDKKQYDLDGRAEHICVPSGSHKALRIVSDKSALSLAMSAQSVRRGLLMPVVPAAASQLSVLCGSEPSVANDNAQPLFGVCKQRKATACDWRPFRPNAS